MKKLLFVVAICGAMMACTNKGTATEVTPATDTVTVDSLDSVVADSVVDSLVIA